MEWPVYDICVQMSHQFCPDTAVNYELISPDYQGESQKLRIILAPQHIFIVSFFLTKHNPLGVRL